MNKSTIYSACFDRHNRHIELIPLTLFRDNNYNIGTRQKEQRDGWHHRAEDVTHRVMCSKPLTLLPPLIVV